MGDAETKIVKIKAYMRECEKFRNGKESVYAKKIAMYNTYQHIKKMLFSEEELEQIKEEALNE